MARDTRKKANEGYMKEDRVKANHEQLTIIVHILYPSFLYKLSGRYPRWPLDTRKLL